MVKNLPVKSGGSGSGSGGQKDPLEKEMTTHSIILDWRIPWTEEPGGLQSVGSQRVGCGGACVHTNKYHYIWFAVIVFSLYCSVLKVSL